VFVVGKDTEKMIKRIESVIHERDPETHETDQADEHRDHDRVMGEDPEVGLVPPEPRQPLPAPLPYGVCDRRGTVPRPPARHAAITACSQVAAGPPTA